MINIVIAKTGVEVEECIKLGYEAIECAIDGKSYGDFDHHADRSYLPAVTKQALNIVFECAFETEFRSNFVALGSADADATFCIYLLSGLWKEGRTPPSRELLESVGNYVALMDVDPIGRRPANDGLAGKIWLLWESMTANNPKDDALSFYLGVAAWRNILSAPGKFQELMDASVLRDKKRISLAEEDMHKSIATKKGAYLLLNGSKVFGFDVWYGRKTNTDPNKVSSWCFPVVAALTDAGNITIGCPNKAVAEALFGLGGLLNLFPKLGEGWGGRESVGGSPRGQTMTVEDLKHIQTILDE